MAFDAHKNLAVATVVTAPSPATSGTSLVVGAGEGARFPAAPFNCTIWPVDMAPTPATAEVVRVTARTTDTLTITRAQEGTTARAVVAGDLIAATITAKSLTDIESGTNFPLITTAGIVTTPTVQAAGSAGVLTVSGGSDIGTSAYVKFYGSAFAGTPANIDLIAVGPGKLNFGTAGAARGVVHPSGGFSWGSTTDPGAGHLSVAGNLRFTGGGVHAIFPNTPDGADTATLYIGAGGDVAYTQGATIVLAGNEGGGLPGNLSLNAGNTATGVIQFSTGPGTERGRIHASGGFSWGGTYDPGPATVFVGTTTFVGGQPSVTLAPNGSITVAAPVTTAHNVCAFVNANGFIGYITTTGSATAYNTSSDARLKTDRGRHTDPDVLRKTIIHNFDWIAGGLPGRGVFAQEAVEVLPCAVSVGSDEVDAEGRLTKPWGVDYSKYVPDLITGWQAHDAELTRLRAEVAALGILGRRGEIPQSPHASVLMRLGMALRNVGNFITGFFPAWITP